MNPIRKALAILLEIARELPLLASALLLLESAAATSASVVPPVVLTNVVVQKYGEEANWEPLPEGTLFWRTGDPWTPDGLYISDGETPGGRAVCSGRGDYHSFTNTVKVNGHRIELNDHMSLQAEAYAVLFRCGTNTLLRISAAKTGGFVRYSVESYSPTGMVIKANVSAAAGASVEVTTDLLDASSWTPATNAAVVAESGESTTWAIDFLDAETQFYRIALGSAVPLDASIAAELPFLANAGIVIPEGQTLRMGSNTWSALPDVGTIATNAAATAVSPVAARVGTLETNAAQHATKSELIAATNTLAGDIAETYATAANLAAVAALAATNAGNIYSNAAGLSWVTNALGQRISAFEKVTIAYAPAAITADTWYIPTNCPTHAMDVQINSSVFNTTNSYCEIRIPAGYAPSGPMRIRMYVWRTHTNARHRFGIGNNAHVTTSGPNARHVEYEWMPETQTWQIHFLQAQNGFDVYDWSGVKKTANFGLPKSIDDWVAWRNQQPW